MNRATPASRAQDEGLRILEQTGARSTRLLEVPDVVDPNAAASVLLDFAEVTRSFALSGLMFCARLGRQLEEDRLSERAADLERLLAKVLGIVAGEFGSPTPEPSKFHYKMFAEMSPAADLEGNGRSSETDHLCRLIGSQLQDPDTVLGFAVLFATESSAPAMVDAFEELLSRLPPGNRDWVDLHLEIEAAHCEEVGEMVAYIVRDDRTADRFIESTTKIGEAYSSFWQAMSSRLVTSGGS